MKDLIIREMQAQDIPAVSRIVCAAFTGAAEREGVAHEEIDRYIFERGSEVAIRAQSHEYSFLVACQGKQIVGMAALKGNEITKAELLLLLIHGAKSPPQFQIKLHFQYSGTSYFSIQTEELTVSRKPLILIVGAIRYYFKNSCRHFVQEIFDQISGILSFRTNPVFECAGN